MEKMTYCLLGGNILYQLEEDNNGNGGDIWLKGNITF